MKHSSFFRSMAVMGVLALSATAFAANPADVPRQEAASAPLVAPGSESCVTLHFAGAQRISIDGRGGLEIVRADGSLRHYRPALSQNVAGKRRAVQFSYHVVDSEHVQLRPIHADPTAPVDVTPLAWGRMNS